MSDNAARTGVFVVLGCVGIAVVVGMGVASWLFFSAVKGGSVDEVAQHLPSDTTSLAVIRGVGDLAVEFREVLTLAETGKSGNKDLEEIRREGQRVLGFDPTSLQAWMDSGLDFTRPWAAATSARLEDMERGIWTVWVPVSDAERVLAMVEQMVKEAGGEHSVTSGEHLIRSRNRDRMAYRLVEDFLVISFSPGHASAAQLRYTPPADGRALFVELEFDDRDVTSPEVFPRPDGTTYVCGLSSRAPLPVDPAQVTSNADADKTLRAMTACFAPTSPPPRSSGPPPVIGRCATTDYR